MKHQLLKPFIQYVMGAGLSSNEKPSENRNNETKNGIAFQIIIERVECREMTAYYYNNT